MKHIFYFFIILPIIWEAMVISSPVKCNNFFKGMKGKKFDDYNSTQRSVGVLTMGYLLWVIIGIFSAQWILFLSLLLISFVPKPWAWLRFIDGVLSFLILICIVMNSYHFHINLQHLIFH